MKTSTTKKNKSKNNVKNNASSNNVTAPKLVKCNLIKVVQWGYKELERIGRNRQNRKVNESHKNEIMKAMMTESGMRNMSSIAVNIRTLHALDGQHRIQAFIELIKNHKLHEDSVLNVLLYDMPEDEEIKVIQDMQKNRTWKQSDYVHKEIEAGNENFKILDEFCQSDPILQEKDGSPKYPYGAMFLTGKHCHSVLKDATFKCTKDDVEKGKQRIEDVKRILDANDLPYYGRPVAPCTTMWEKYKDRINLDELVKFMGNKRNHARPDELRQIQKNNEKKWAQFFERYIGMVSDSK